MMRALLSIAISWLLLIVATCICIQIAINISNVAISKIMEEHAAQAWPETDAHIIASRLDQERIRRIIWRPIYTYQYTVNGKQYTSDRQSIGSGRGYENIQDANMNIIKHPIGSILRIKYNPKTPHQSTITIYTDHGLIDYIAILVSFLILLLPGYVYYFLFKKDRLVI
ncbi:DUF3592 domain-containing protein [Aquitalea sp. ASV11]|uniref:DUF3592 domain-containing protein n=1 Tax=Aquitalea sp. ASV11 TaxID=2795103 RepID=UPI0018EC4257|nr:DUF3592 domain-containing protein [Aquitalea sp. ASV11]